MLISFRDTFRHFVFDLPFARCPPAGELGFTPPNRRAAAFRKKTSQVDSRRPPPLGLAVSRVERLELGAGHRSTRDGACLASRRLLLVLDLAGAARPSGTTRCFSRDSRSDPAGCAGKIRVGEHPAFTGSCSSSASTSARQRQQIHGALPQAASQTWRTFLENHAQQLVSIDFFTVPTLRFQVVPIRKSILIERVELAARRGRVQGNVRTPRFPALLPSPLPSNSCRSARREPGTPSSASCAAARAPKPSPAIAILRPTRLGLALQSLV